MAVLISADVRELHQNACTREEEYVRSALELGILIAKETHHEKCDSNVGVWFPAHKSVFYGSFEADSGVEKGLILGDASSSALSCETIVAETTVADL